VTRSLTLFAQYESPETRYRISQVLEVLIIDHSCEIALVLQQSRHCLPTRGRLVQRAVPTSSFMNKEMHRPLKANKPRASQWPHPHGLSHTSRASHSENGPPWSSAGPAAMPKAMATASTSPALAPVRVHSCFLPGRGPLFTMNTLGMVLRIG